MKMWAISALIISGGAMLAAMAAAFVAFLALRQGRSQNSLIKTV